MLYTSKVPFLIKNQWRWIKWTHTHGNKHAAIHEKACELGAARWDYSQAEHVVFGEG